MTQPPSARQSFDLYASDKYPAVKKYRLALAEVRGGDAGMRRCARSTAHVQPPTGPTYPHANRQPPTNPPAPRLEEGGLRHRRDHQGLDQARGPGDLEGRGGSKF
jgi:hypothetical protein